MWPSPAPSFDRQVVAKTDPSRVAADPAPAIASDVKTATDHVVYLDGLRGLALMSLLEDHFIGYQPMGLFYDTGRVGLDVFFALSGFLIAGLLFVRKQPLAKFYKRRISRIFPAFLIFVISIFAYSLIVGIPFSVSELISTLLFLRTYIPGTGIWATSVPIGHIWTLNVEEHAYFFMSLLVLFGLFRKHRGIALVLCGIGCLGITILYAKLGDNAPHWAGLGTETVAAHVLIAGGYRLIVEKFRIKVPTVLPVLTFLLALPLYSHLLPWWGRLFTPFLMAITINHLSQTFAAIKSFLSIKAFQQMGIWSYSIYLWQQPFQIAGGTFSQVAGRIGITMLLALFSFYILENPARTWLNQNW